MIVHTGQDTHRTDSVMEKEYKVFPLQLMEVAGKNVADQVHLDFSKNLNDVLILIGPGNNGGDGCVVARFLISYGWNVTILPVFETKPSNSPAHTNANIARELCKNPKNNSVFLDSYEKSEKTREKISIYLKNKKSCIVDAIFGVGLTRKIIGYTSELIEIVNNSQNKKFSVDISSGISSENGNMFGENDNSAIKADVTVTFEAPKVGHLIYPGKEHTGNLVITNIGIPKNIVEENVSINTYLNCEQAKELIKSRPSNSHKGLFGRVLCLAGSKQYQGAITLVLEGAIHTGVGLITSCYKESLSNILSQRVIPEAIHCPISVVNGIYTDQSLLRFDSSKNTVMCIGSGIGRDIDVQKFVRKLYYSTNLPMVIDADALFALKDDLVKNTEMTKILTPHIGEMSYLTDISKEDIKRELVKTALLFAKKWNSFVILKSATTVIASPSGEAFINYFGSSALAKGGSGDVLSGTIAGFLAQGYEPMNAAILSVTIHSIAAQIMEEKETSWCASILNLPKYYAEAIRKILN